MMKNKTLMLFAITTIFLLGIMSVSAYTGTGGTITTDGSYVIHTFTSNGTFNISNDVPVEVLVIAGGGGGGGINSGGGGAGGLIYNSSMPLTTGSYPVVVGLGGVGGAVFINQAGRGGNSSFNNYIALGGGAGGQYDVACSDGGSGGGRGGQFADGCFGTSGQGNQGGGGFNGAVTYAGGGGGGAGGNGTTANSTTAGNGGTGLSYSINGTSICYAGGGGGAGGGGINSTATCGGGRGYSGGDGHTSTGDNGTDGLGGGGGGSNNNPETGGFGGSGVVVIRYLQTSSIAFVSPTDIDTFAYNRQNIIVNVTMEDYGVGISNLTVYFYNETFDLVGSVNSTTSPLYNNFSTGADGIFYFNATGCDNSSACADSETRWVRLDTINPVVNILYPVNSTTYDYAVNIFNFTTANAGNISNCWYILNNNPLVFVNCTESVVNNYTGLSSIEGLNNLSVYSNDTVGLVGYDENFYTVDTTPPTYVDIISPINTTYSSSSQLLNVSTDGDIITFNLNGVNDTYTVPVSITIQEGSNELQVWSSDLYGNINSTIVYFTLVSPPSVTSNAIYQVMNGAGAGLGIFIQILAQALPVLLIVIGFVGVILYIGVSLKNVIVKGILSR